MKRLTDPAKRRIVELLAHYHTHAEVAAQIAREFGITITPRHVRAYDPMSFQFAGADRWRQFHQTERERANRAFDSIPIAHRAYRLNQLQRALELAMKQNDSRQALVILRQAAREMRKLAAGSLRRSDCRG